MENLKDVVGLVVAGVSVICLTIAFIVSIKRDNKKDDKIEELQENLEECMRNEARHKREIEDIEKNVPEVKEYRDNQRLERMKRIIA